MNEISTKIHYRINNNKAQTDTQKKAKNESK